MAKFIDKNQDGQNNPTTLTEKQIYDLNNMNVAAQNVELGTLLNSILEKVNDIDSDNSGGEDEGGGK
jgi:hypothetical protein